ncbi:unnamed protein product [Adineta steineri]|uniref:Uncharacterized protein n=1 Tax=Adineta steineri TaxID=433720 RepID=A0A818NGM1_9BILA|nr:unnamed protein product [Adineta steineri]CAF3606617.1 unnamed protein product [Adineta steineri]
MQVSLFILVILSIVTSSFALWPFSSNKDECPIKPYNPKDSSFTGMKLYTNQDTFHPILLTLSKYAKDCNVKIRVKQAFIQENSKIINEKINDHSEMAFRLGEAIEFELVDKKDNLLCNKICLQKDVSTLGVSEAKCFLQKFSKISDLRQDAIKPNILLRQTTPVESLIKLQDKRKDIQNKCIKLKMDA